MCSLRWLLSLPFPGVFCRLKMALEKLHTLGPLDVTYGEPSLGRQSRQAFVCLRVDTGVSARLLGVGERGKGWGLRQTQTAV